MFYMCTRSIVFYIRIISTNLDRKCPSDCNDEFLLAILIDLDDKEWNDINVIDKRSSNNVFFLDISHLHHGYLFKLASISIKVWLRAANTATTPALAEERGRSTYRILIDVYLPAIGSHGILQVELEIIRVLQIVDSYCKIVSWSILCTHTTAISDNPLMITMLIGVLPQP